MAFSDPSDTYANQKNFFIEFEYFHAAKQKTGTNEPSVGRVKFKAFLTSYTDSFDSKWNEELVYGRIDPIYTFQNTTRIISLAWDAPSASLEEAKQNMARASSLMRYLYPTYTDSGDATTITKPPLLRMKFVNLIKLNANTGLLGKVNGFKFEPDMEVGWWDGDRTLNGGMTNILYPKSLKFSCEFHVIHEQPLGWTQEGTWEIIKEQIGPEGFVDFDYEKNSFPYMAWKQSANDTLGIKTPAEILNEQDIGEGTTQEEANANNPVPDNSAEIRAQEAAQEEQSISDQQAEDEAVSQPQADSANPSPLPEYITDYYDESLLSDPTTFDF